MPFLKSIFYSCVLLLIFYSCKKESFITSMDAALSTSVDTLSYDTVFTSVGSVTQSFKIFNNNNQKLLLSQVALAGGNSSSFKINVDGASANEVDDIEVNANDSIYVFVQVKIDPASGNLPFIIRDSILINYNGNKKFVQLQAYGQNANFLKNVKLTGNVTWTDTLPYVILGGLLVDSNAVLTIQEGAKIFLHPNAPFLVDGTLIVNGSKEGRVVFAGDRLDPDYVDFPASWPGIYFSGSSQKNNLKFAVILNAYQGVVARDLSLNTIPKVTLSQCIIDNIYDAGVLGINTNISADNCLISNCGKNILLALGGDYSFVHCTVASYGNFFIDHKNPVLQISNSAGQGNTTSVADLKAVFTNCIFWGEGGAVENEILVTKEPAANPFSVHFDNVLYKLKDADPADAIFSGNVLKNMSPSFDSINVSKNYYDFHFKKDPSAPAIDMGTVTPFKRDLDDSLRTGTPDLGCYER
ncbi:MAG: hypothetical protein M3015_04540 [Bacteroidota bacterium]|nr:hypothetical protein [Bacteroidota bacterium]